MRKLGTWLGIVALALQLAWPLLATAKPRSVTLVPLCTVDGVTHYLEVRTGKSPLEESPGHGDHCPLCCLGQAPALLSHFLPSPAVASTVGVGIALSTPFSPKPVVRDHGARGPPSSSFPTV